MGCDGVVFFGKRFMGTPEAPSKEVSFFELLTSAKQDKPVHGEITCSNSAMGGDPLPNQVKWCWCLEVKAGRLSEHPSSAQGPPNSKPEVNSTSVHTSSVQSLQANLLIQ